MRAAVAAVVVASVVVALVMGVLDDAWTSFWDWSERYAGGIAAMASVAAAVAAIAALRNASADSRERTRPVVIAEFRDAPLSDKSALEIVVRNAGGSLAKNLRVRFKPELPTTDKVDRKASYYLGRQFANPVPVLAQGQELSNVWWATGHPDAEVNRHDTPAETTVHVEYEDSFGRPYEDSISLSVEPYVTQVSITSSTSVPGSLKLLNAKLEQLVQTAKTIASKT